MTAFVHSLAFRHRAARLLACGMLAIALHLLAGSGLMRKPSAGSALLVEICSGQGVRSVDAAPLSDTPLPGSEHRECCKLCGAGVPMLLVDAMLGVPSAPTFGSLFSVRSVSPFTAQARVSPPPRGPPLV